VIRTDGWKRYNSVSSLGYTHEVTVLKGKKESASELLPRVHMVISLTVAGRDPSRSGQPQASRLLPG
jgi:hypothetical protein